MLFIKLTVNNLKWQKSNHLLSKKNIIVNFLDKINCKSVPYNPQNITIKWLWFRKTSIYSNLLPVFFSFLRASASKYTWRAPYQVLISDTFSSPDVHWCIREEKTNWAVAWPKSQSFTKLVPPLYLPVFLNNTSFHIHPHPHSTPPMWGKEWSGEMRCSISVFCLPVQ